MPNNQNDLQAWEHCLLGLGHAIQRHLRTAVDAAGLAVPVAHESGDTIYGMDRLVEPVITREIEAWPDHLKPLVVIAEGMGAEGRLRFGREDGPARYRVIIDPVDGTRGLMYDKRSAWFLGAVAPDLGEETSLANVVASVIVELPTAKQCWADSFSATCGSPSRGTRRQLVTGQQRPLVPKPSTAVTLRDGFGQVSNFFPGTKVLAAELMERIVEATLGELRPGSADVLDDQYISTGGQMVELLLGHDRFCCDLRPLFYDIIHAETGRKVRGVECHPYDLGGLLVAQQAGVELTDGFGQPLTGLLDVHTGMHWCGYANRALRDLVQPVVAAWLFEKGLKPSR
jgi:hypothetical protein